MSAYSRSGLVSVLRLVGVGWGRCRAKGAYLALLVVVVMAHPQPSSACGLHHPSVAADLFGSYPGALEIAVAVAAARDEGLLAPAAKNLVSNVDRLQHILVDLRQFQMRLKPEQDASIGAMQPFSLLLVGPGLWSVFHPTPGGVLARFHVAGPVPDQAIVLTHPVVLRALLTGRLSMESAVKLGLVKFSDDDSELRVAVIKGFDAQERPVSRVLLPQCLAEVEQAWRGMVRKARGCLLACADCVVCVLTKENV